MTGHRLVVDVDYLYKRGLAVGRLRADFAKLRAFVEEEYGHVTSADAYIVRPSLSSGVDDSDFLLSVADSGYTLHTYRATRDAFSLIRPDISVAILEARGSRITLISGARELAAAVLAHGNVNVVAFDETNSSDIRRVASTFEIIPENIFRVRRDSPTSGS